LSDCELLLGDVTLCLEGLLRWRGTGLLLVDGVLPLLLLRAAAAAVIKPPAPLRDMLSAIFGI
jgi:hypothetical protein